MANTCGLAVFKNNTWVLRLVDCINLKLWFSIFHWQFAVYLFLWRWIVCGKVTWHLIYNCTLYILVTFVLRYFMYLIALSISPSSQKESYLFIYKAGFCWFHTRNTSQCFHYYTCDSYSVPRESAVWQCVLHQIL